MEYVKIVAGSANLPTKDDRDWLKNPERTDFFVRWENENDVRVAALNEIATATRLAYRRHDHRELTLANFNNNFPDQIGNAIDTRRSVKVLDQKNIRIRTLARPRGLNMVAALLDFGDNALAVEIALHFISNGQSDNRALIKMAQMSRARCLEVIIDYSHECERVGLPVIPSGDTNSGVWAEHELNKAGIPVAFRDGVDLIAASKSIKASNGKSHADGLGKASDHRWITVELEIPVAGPGVRRRLP